jgi:hypothetical protein
VVAERDKKIRVLHAEGKTFRAIAPLVGCSAATCQRVIAHGGGAALVLALSDDAIELADLVDNDLFLDDGSVSKLALHRLRYLDTERTPEQAAKIAAAWAAVPIEPIPREPSLYG